MNQRRKRVPHHGRIDYLRALNRTLLSHGETHPQELAAVQRRALGDLFVLPIAKVLLRTQVRENGGQYTHAAVWTAMAFAAMGEARRAGTFFV